MIRRPPRSTPLYSSAASDVYKRQDTTTSQWAQGHGNLKVISLHESTALVKWPKDEVFMPHSHWGGEEIYVLSGTFMDENGEYKKDTWIRNHHRSAHHPFVKEETIIFVKTGHL